MFNNSNQFPRFEDLKTFQHNEESAVVQAIENLLISRLNSGKVPMTTHSISPGVRSHTLVISEVNYPFPMLMHVENIPHAVVEELKNRIKAHGWDEVHVILGKGSGMSSTPFSGSMSGRFTTDYGNRPSIPPMLLDMITSVILVKYDVSKDTSKEPESGVSMTIHQPPVVSYFIRNRDKVDTNLDPIVNLGCSERDLNIIREYLRPGVELDYVRVVGKNGAMPDE